MTHVLVIDNYDSFVYTLNGYLLQLGAETTVVRNDAFAAADAGAYIRRPSQYTPLYLPEFKIEASYPVRCGVCDYQAFVLEPDGVTTFERLNV